MKALKISFILMFALITSPMLSAQGNFELGFHYGPWSLSFVEGLIEEGLSEALEDQLTDKIMEDVQDEHPGFKLTSYNQTISFDSGGHNWGFGFRWYPKGKTGSFSLGFSVEKTKMKVSFDEVKVSMQMSDGSTFDGEADAEFQMNPLSFHLSFRWDIIPSSKIRPYMTFGLGMATGTALEKGEISYSYSGDLNIAGGEPERFESSDKKTLQEIKDEFEGEEEFVFPDIIPFLQLNFGVKGEFTENFYFLVDAGIWNGFLLRGGLAFRF